MFRESHTFATRLQEARRASGMSQENVAGHIGLSKKTISNYESGTTIPKADCLELLAQLYGVSAAWFFRPGIDPYLSDPDEIKRLVEAAVKLNEINLKALTAYALWLCDPQ